MNINSHALTFIATIALTTGFSIAADPKLLNVSYDPTRELYEEINAAFNEAREASGEKPVDIQQSHGGGSKQARSVIDGLKADVVTLALSGDIAAIEKAGLIQPGWQKEFPQNSTPFTSTIIFIVRKGNPKAIKDWNDLIKPDVKVVTPNPKTSGGARWNLLAAWAYGAGVQGKDFAVAGEYEKSVKSAAEMNSFPAIDDAKGLEFVTALLKNVPVLDTGARGSLVTFAQKNIGDVFISWENEAYLAKQEYGEDKFEIIYPSVSILAEPPVAIVDQNVDQKNTRVLAESYLKFLYSLEAQQIIAENHYRPRDAAVLSKNADTLPPIKLFTIDEVFGGWAKAQPHFFSDGGVFDQIYKSSQKR